MTNDISTTRKLKIEIGSKETPFLPQVNLLART